MYDTVTYHNVTYLPAESESLWRAVSVRHWVVSIRALSSGLWQTWAEKYMQNNKGFANSREGDSLWDSLSRVVIEVIVPVEAAEQVDPNGPYFDVCRTDMVNADLSAITDRLDPKGRYTLLEVGPVKIDIPAGIAFWFDKAVGSDSVLNAGDRVYWDSVSRRATADAADHTKLGIVLRDAGSLDTMVMVGCWMEPSTQEPPAPDTLPA
jgi:hypothetical protein